MNLNLSGNVLAHLRRLLEHLDVMEVVPQDLVVAPNASHQFQDFALPEQLIVFEILEDFSEPPFHGLIELF